MSFAIRGYQRECVCVCVCEGGVKYRQVRSCQGQQWRAGSAAEAI